MDAVELPFPVDVAAAPKLMGPEGFARAGVTVKEVEGRGSDRVSIMVNHSILIENGKFVAPDVAHMKSDTEFHAPDEFPETELTKSSSTLPNLQSEEVLKNVYAKGKNCTVITSRPEGMPLPQKTGKVHRSNSSGSKRPRISEDSTNLKAIENSKDNCDNLGSNHIKCSSSEKTQLSKQKSNASKRGDKRTSKVPSKAKFDSSSMKLGAAIFNSASGGNNFFGLYGLKHDIHDVTKLADEPTFDELLRGTFDCPSLSKDKGRKTSNMNENFLSSIRKACSILHFPKSVQSLDMAEMDSSPTMKMPPCESSSVSLVESGENGDKGSCATDVCLCQKDSCNDNTEAPANPLDFPLYQPKDVLERIALPPSRDLESLLLDASKPVVASRSSNDLRPSKQVTRRPSLPTFPWSHALGGHCRTNTDTVKLSSRSACQGKWARIGITVGFTGNDRGCFTNLDSFSYDQSLVPSFGSSDNKVFPSFCAPLPFCNWDSSSSATCSKDVDSQVDNKKYDGICPRVLAAAKTLCEMASNSSRQNPKGTVGWQKKTLHKTTKARNFKSDDKHEMLSRTGLILGSDMLSRSVEQIMPSKKPRLSIMKNKDGGPSSSVKKGPCTWASSKSSRSLPSKSSVVREGHVENKHSSGNILKQQCMMPPPASRVLDKAYESPQKLRKVVLMDWKRGRDK